MSPLTGCSGDGAILSCLAGGRNDRSSLDLLREPWMGVAGDKSDSGMTREIDDVNTASPVTRGVFNILDTRGIQHNTS